MFDRRMNPIKTIIIYRECKTVIESHLYKKNKNKKIKIKAPGIRLNLRNYERDIDASLHFCPQH
jgi:hypothetical protein